MRLAFGWPLLGGYRFLVDGAPYGEGLPEDGDALLDPHRTALDDLHLEAGHTWRLLSPMPGGGWALQLRVTEVLPAEACVGRPALEGGQRTAPPWRTAGPEAFVRFVQAHEAPRHPAHAWAHSISPEPYPIRVAWRPLRIALRDADWAQHRRPAPARKADPIHALLRGPQP